METESIKCTATEWLKVVDVGSANALKTKPKSRPRQPKHITAERNPIDNVDDEAPLLGLTPLEE